MKHVKKCILCNILILSFVTGFFQPVTQVKATVSHRDLQHSIAITDEHVDGSVLVTLATPKKTALCQEGVSSFDKHIVVEDSYNMGEADNIANTAPQKDFLKDKTYYISEVSSSTYSTEELIQALEKKAYVLDVEPNYKQHITSNDPYSSRQWYLDGNSIFGSSSGIHYSTTTAKSKSGEPVIAVMDTGIHSSHEDLASHMWTNSTSTFFGAHGYNAIDDNGNCEDDNGHGTHCAGTIAAIGNNQTGITGISQAKIMSLKVFDADGETDNATIIRGLNYLIGVKKSGVNIIAVNCSWGGGASNSSMAQLMTLLGEMGVTFVFAAGNDGINHDINTDAICPYDLSDYNSKLKQYMIFVGASTANDTACSFSDYGSRDVDLFAPGENIFSTYHEPTYHPDLYGTDLGDNTTLYRNCADTKNDLSDFYVDDDLQINSSMNANIEYTSSANHSYHTSSGSIRWLLDYGSPSGTPKSTYLYLDVTKYNLNPEDTHYVSMYLGTPISKKTISWDHITKVSSGPLGSENNRFYLDEDGAMYFKIIGIEANEGASGSYLYYLDDIGISTANPTKEQIGEYTYLTGSSMAAPMVTGALALLHEIYPTDDAYNRNRRLLSCTRVTLGVIGKCSTNGILDMSKMDLYTPVATPSPSTGDSSTEIHISATKQIQDTNPANITIENITTTKSPIKIKKIIIKNKKKSLRAGKKLKLKAVVTPAHAKTPKIRWSTSRKKWASVTQKGIVTAKKRGIGHTVKITATARDGSGKKAVCRIKIKK